MSEEGKILNSAVEFIDFINSEEPIKESIQKNFEAVWGNMSDMKKSLSQRPCGCGGVNPDAVIAERRNNLENFYKSWIFSLNTDQVEVLRSALKDKITLKSNNEIILQT